MKSPQKQRTGKNAPWVVIAGGVHRRGGTDKANFALVEFLLEQDIPVEVVAHEIDPNLLQQELHQSEVCLIRSEEHTSELQSLTNLVCRLLLEKKKNQNQCT